MTISIKRAQAISLRESGLSYNKIKEIVQVSKSTLSLWLRNMPLTKQKIIELRDNNVERIEKFKSSMILKRTQKLDRVYQDVSTFLPLDARETYIAGLFLYWGEGNKAHRNTLSIANTDPEVIIFSLKWFKESLNVPKEKIKILLHIYSDMDEKTEKEYWSTKLQVPEIQFNRSYIKKTTRSSIDHKGYGHGTCTVMVHDTMLKDRVIMALKAVKDSSVQRAES